MTKRKKLILTIAAVTLLTISIAGAVMFHIAAKDLTLGMCRTYHREDPKCIELMRKAGDPSLPPLMTEEIDQN